LLAATPVMMSTAQLPWTRRWTLATLAVGLLSACSGSTSHTSPSNGGDSGTSPDPPDAAPTEAKLSTSWRSARPRGATRPLREDVSRPGLPDAALLALDSAVAPDATVLAPDATVLPPDATVPAPDVADATPGVRAWCPIPGCTPVAPVAGSDLHGVWVGPAGEVWAVGQGGTVGRRSPDAEGGSWCWCQPVPTPASGPAPALNAIWGSSSDEVWIVGAAGTVLRFGGAGFATIGVSTSADLHAVWGSSTSNLFIVGDAGTTRHFDGQRWSSADVGAEHALHGVWGASATSVWAVGSVPVLAQWGGAEAEILRWNPGTGGWVRETAFLEERGAAHFSAISGSSASDVWAVGAKFPSGAAAGFAYAAHFDGTRWTPAETEEDVRISRSYSDVVAHAPGASTGAWIAGGRGGAVLYDGTTWSAAAADTAGLLALDFRGNDLWAAGVDGKVMRHGPGGWLTVRAPTP